MKKYLALLVVGLAVMFAQPFENPAKAQPGEGGSTVYCYCTFWGTCKIGGGGGLCQSYFSGIGGDCTESNGNCSIFNP